MSTIRSSELLRLLATDDGAYLLDELGAPHRDDLKRRTITLRAADGREIGGAGAQILEDMIRERLVYEAVPLDEKYRRTYRLTPDGLARGKKLSENR